MNIPIGVTYIIAGEGDSPLTWRWTFEGAHIQSEKNSCNGWTQCSATVPPDGASVVVNFHYICNSPSC